MKILITGGFGYLGGRLSQFLSNKDQYQIILASRSSREIPTWAPNTEAVSIDWENDELIDKLTSQVDVIVHLAGLNAQDCLTQPIKAIEVNAIKTARIVQSAIRQNVKRFVYMSTAHVYRSPLKGLITEKSNLSNFHPYATSHRSGEDVLRLAHKRKEIEGIVIRLSNAYGCPTHIDANCWMLLVNDLCRQAITTKGMILKSPNEVRNFITIRDFCSAMEHLLKLPLDNLGDGLFNLGGNSAKVIDMAEIIQARCLQMLGFSPKIIFQHNIQKKVGSKLNYSVKKLLSTGWQIKNDSLFEIDKTLYFCNEYFGDAP